MKLLLFVTFLILGTQHDLLGQTVVPDYVKEALKEDPVKAGTYTNYDFAKAKKRPTKVIELDLNYMALTKVPEAIKNFRS